MRVSSSSSVATRNKDDTACKVTLFALLGIGCVIVMILGTSTVLNSQMNEFNPDADLSIGDFTLTSKKLALTYIRDDCEVRIIKQEEIPNSNSTKCSSVAVLSTESAIVCDELTAVQARPFPLKTPCFKRADCQGDVCKYNCNFTWVKQSDVTVEVRPSVTGKTYIKSVVLKGGPVKLREFTMCDYTLNAQDSSMIDSLYINPHGDRTRILVRYFAASTIVSVALLVFTYMLSLCSGIC